MEVQNTNDLPQQTPVQHSSYLNVAPSSKEESGFKGKLKTLKSLVKFPSFSSNSTSTSQNQTASDINTTQNDLQQKPKTCKDKLEQKIVEKVEVERNIAIFVMLISLGFGLLCISLFLIPFIITSPSKFSLCFAMGSLLVLVSFLFFHGTKKYFSMLFSKERFWVSVIFILSIFIGVGFSLGKHYIISFLCSLFQLVALVLFFLSFIPGGKVGIDCIKRAVTSPFTGIWMRMVSSQINS